MIRSLLEKLGFRPKIRSVPTWYAGIRFASTLEADWARTFDDLAIGWSYEPIAYQLSNGQLYRCDFWLPGQRVWCEVKGPHDLRIEKPRRLEKDIGCDGDDWRAPMVVICREAERGIATIETTDGRPAGFMVCPNCSHNSIVDPDRAWQCRICGQWSELTGGLTPMSFVQGYRTADRTAA